MTVEFSHILRREIEVTIRAEGYYHPGNTWGPPETCYPAEGEANPEAVIGDDGSEVDFETWASSVQLTAEERERIDDAAMAAIMDEYSNARSRED